MAKQLKKGKTHRRDAYAPLAKSAGKAVATSRVLLPRMAFEDGNARPAYLDGVWAYAVGRDAREHGDYDRAVRRAERGRWDPGWIRSWADVEAVEDYGCWFSEDAALEARRFFSRILRLIDGAAAGRPFELADYQFYDIVGPLYGWRRGDGTRRVRDGSLWIPKKNAKSAIGSGIASIELTRPLEAHPHVVCAAGSRKQAGIIFDAALRMMMGSVPIRKRIHPVPSTKHIAHKTNHGKFEALSCDADTNEGWNWTCCLVDEIHAQKRPKFYETLAGGGIGRVQELMFKLSTAGDHRAGIGWDEWQLALKWLAGSISDWEYLGRAYFSPDDADWMDWDEWIRANPGVGITTTEEKLGALMRKAINQPGQLNRILRYHLNRWTQKAERFLNIVDWDACGRKWPEPVRLEAMRGREAWAAYDGSSKLDLTSLALIWPPDHPGGPLYVWTHSWIPKKRMREKMDEDRVPYDRWVDEGWVTATEGSMIDREQVYADICYVLERVPVREFAADPAWFGEIENWLLDDGQNVVTFAQTMKNYTAAMAELEARAMAGTLAHGNNPVLRWACENLMARHKFDGSMGPDKQAAVERIDPAIATLMAMARWLVSDAAEGLSIYERDDILVVDL